MKAPTPTPTTEATPTPPGDTMPAKPCLTCGALSPHSRCPLHQRPTARHRGYNHDHDQLRATLLPHAYGRACPRCGQPMLPGQALDLGHSVARAHDPHARGDRIEHARCNRSAGVG